MTGRVIRQFAEDLNAKAEPPEEEPRTSWKQPLSRKEITDGDAVATCGHVEPGMDVFTFDGFWKHEDVPVFFMACCPACAVQANYDLTKVAIVEVVTFGGEP